MDFFDELIKETESIFDPCDKTSFDADGESWADAGESHIVLQRDTAFELDGVGFNLVTSSPLGSRGVALIGDDLQNIRADRAFARVSFVEIDDVGDEQKAYDLIRKIEYVKYHCFPTGYMIRTSSREQKEVVRVAKSAVKKGITFEKVGNLFNEKFLQIQSVKKVQTVFVTLADFDYKALEEIAMKNNEIAKTLNHIMNSVNFDCNSCKLKPICDEVEGMRELHFKNAHM